MQSNELYLNPFSIVVEKEKKYFFGKNTQTINTSNGLSLTDNQEAVFLKLIAGEGLSAERAKEYFGEENFSYLKEQNILLPLKIDMGKIYSRSITFLKNSNIKNILEVLEKNILILGCGGIGTHVAWNLLATGITNLTLLDFDTIEMSNLNRQILYTSKEIGKKKTESLKEKLLEINPEAKISVLNIKIQDEKQLEEIISKSDCDLIIKSLDSPEEFPLWLDNVCRKLKKKYISGTLSDTFSVIGPTFLPGKYEVGYSDIFSESKDFKHVSGINPSLSSEVSYAASKISAEAIRVLSGNYENCLYTGKINFMDILSNKSMDVFPSNHERELDEFEKINRNKNILIVLLALSTILQTAIYPRIVFLLGLLIPFSSALVYDIPENASKACFINTIVYYTLCTFSFIVFNHKILDTYSPVQILSLIFGIFILFSLITFIFVVLSYYLTKIRKRKTYNEHN